MALCAFRTRFRTRLMTACHDKEGGTPSDVNLAALRTALETLPGVAAVHDLHVWALTSGVYAMSLHAVLKDDAGHDEVCLAIRQHARSAFKINHSTVQVERACCPPAETHS